MYVHIKAQRDVVNKYVLDAVFDVSYMDPLERSHLVEQVIKATFINSF